MSTTCPLYKANVCMCVCECVNRLCVQLEARVVTCEGGRGGEDVEGHLCNCIVLGTCKLRDCSFFSTRTMGIFIHFQHVLCQF